MATIMIVEDDRQTNDAVAEYLKSFGYRMLSAYDGDEALQLFECNNIDLIILDIMIPKKTGLAVLHTIRAKSSVPILMLTAIGDEYTQVTSFDEQADDYITKPFSMVLLGRRVTALLRRSGQTVSPDIMTFGDVTVDFSGYTAKGPEGKIINYYGSAVVTPYAKTVMSEILPYLGFYPEYTDEEYADRNVTVPLVQEKSLDSATATLDDMGLSYEGVGEGSSVVSQCPKTGAVIEKGGKVILYTEENTEPEVVEVPNLIGLSAAEANTALTQLGLNIVTMGASSDNADAKVQFQSEPAGTSVEVGTVINLTMSINDQSG